MKAASSIMAHINRRLTAEIGEEEFECLQYLHCRRVSTSRDARGRRLIAPPHAGQA